MALRVLPQLLREHSAALDWLNYHTDETVQFLVWKSPRFVSVSPCQLECSRLRLDRMIG